MIVIAKSSSLKEISKQCYRIIYKFHDLEKSGKKRKVLSFSNSNEICFYVLQENLFEFLNQTIKSENVFEQEKLQKFNKKLSYFSSTVTSNLYSKRPLQKKVVSKFLTAFTKTMNYIENDDIEINTDLWAKIVLNAVMIWDHKL